MTRPDTVSLTQTYLEKPTKTKDGQESVTPVWRFSFSGVIHGDFSTFNDETIPVLRIGGFCFGYYLTTLGYLKKDPNAVVRINETEGSGTLQYRYKTTVNGVSHSYAEVSFVWDKQRLKVKFQAVVNEGKITPEIDVPVEVGNEKPAGLIIGVTPCYIAFSNKRFHAPAGLTYQGSGGKAKTGGNKGSYQAALTVVHGILTEKPGPPEQ